MLLHVIYVVVFITCVTGNILYATKFMEIQRGETMEIVCISNRPPAILIIKKDKHILVYDGTKFLPPYDKLFDVVTIQTKIETIQIFKSKIITDENIDEYKARYVCADNYKLDYNMPFSSEVFFYDNNGVPKKHEL